MAKIFACILIFISCTALGFIKASSYSARRSELENTLELIRLLDLEISYRKDSLHKTFKRVSQLKPCWFSKVLEDCSAMLTRQNSLQKSWDYALKKNIPACPLQNKDMEILKDISMGLGRSDTQGQKNIFKPAVTRFEACIAEAKNAEAKMGKMYRSLGIASGIVIAVMLI